MEATEIAEKIRGEEHEAHSAAEDSTFRKYTGIYLGIVAMLLAITALGGAHAIVNSNIQASDTYGFHQARNIRPDRRGGTRRATPCAARYARGGQDQDSREDYALSGEGRPLRDRPVDRRRQKKNC